VIYKCRAMYPHVVLVRFVGVVGASAVAILTTVFAIVLIGRREKPRRARREVDQPGRSVGPNGDTDHAKFGKDAQTHHSVQGPFLTVY